MVTTEAPSACAANIVHDFTDSPSSRTVHAPHDDVSHPILVPVSPHASRRYCTSRVRGSTSWSWAPPFTVMPICMLLLVSPGAWALSLAHRRPRVRLLELVLPRF